MLVNFDLTCQFALYNETTNLHQLDQLHHLFFYFSRTIIVLEFPLSESGSRWVSLKFWRKYGCSCHLAGLRWEWKGRGWFLLPPSDLWLQFCPFSELCGDGKQMWQIKKQKMKGKVSVEILIQLTSVSSHSERFFFSYTYRQINQMQLSHSHTFVSVHPFSLYSIVAVKIAWELELCLFMFVAPRY